MGCLPPHNLKLNIRTPIIIIWNSQHTDMVRSTRAVVSSEYHNVIEATKLDGTTIIIPRFTIITSDSSNTISFKTKKKFAVMTINRSQGQAIKSNHENVIEKPHIL